jgi:hypothetical protein
VFKSVLFIILLLSYCYVICHNINWLLKCNNVDYYHTFIPLLQSDGIMKKILFVTSLILLLPLFACLQPHVKSVEHLQGDYDRLQSLQISLERDLLHAPDPLKVENYLREVELRMRYIEIEILKRQFMEN